MIYIVIIHMPVSLCQISGCDAVSYHLNNYLSYHLNNYLSYHLNNYLSHYYWLRLTRTILVYMEELIV